MHRAVADGALLAACEVGNVHAANQALQNGGDIARLTTRGDWTPLMIASVQAHAPLVELLIAHGAKLDAHTDDGLTALHLAAMQGHARITELLLGAGAEINAVDLANKTPIYWAAVTGHVVVLTVLVAAANADLAISSTPNGFTALHEACARGRDDVARMLLAAGADPECTNRSGRTPLFTLLMQDDLLLPSIYRCAHVLVAYGANVDAFSEELLADAYAPIQRRVVRAWLCVWMDQQRRGEPFTLVSNTALASQASRFETAQP